MAISLTKLCVYTIKHSGDLVEGRSGTFHEKRPWTTARRLLELASQQNATVPIIFAEAERTDNLVAWAVLESIEITENGTDYRFRNLTRFRKPLLQKTVLRKRNGHPLSDRFIRPYAICRRPDFLG